MPPADERADHWDLMFESGSELLTFASPPFPQSGSWTIDRLPPHRLLYLEYEGPISQNRGCVTRVDRGHFAREDRKAGRVTLQLSGLRLVGRLTIERQVAEGPHSALAEDPLAGEGLWQACWQANRPSALTSDGS
jgi:hypothetical protein